MKSDAQIVTLFLWLFMFGTALAQQAAKVPDVIFEGLPTPLEQRVQQNNQILSSAVQTLPHSQQLQFFLAPVTMRWKPGSTITVAFNGGDDKLYSEIQSAADSWIVPGAANLKFQFTDTSGHYLHWSDTDTAYSADIRIEFASGNMGGYWSLIGTDSINKAVVAPNQPSMNFQGFDQQLPLDWAGTVRHEFGHALGFEHEHQSPSSDCGFRLDDDPGYIKSTDSNGWYTSYTTPEGKILYPGLYTYLGGKANYWSPEKVDFNLKVIPNTRAFTIGPYDKMSIMEYYFDPFFFKFGAKSPCYVVSENEVLSAQDIKGADAAYPVSQPAINELAALRSNQVKMLLSQPALSATVKTTLKAQMMLSQ